MSALMAVKMGQQAAERLMSDACVVDRVVRGVAHDGLDTVTTVRVYAGRCRVQYSEQTETTVERGDAPVTQQRYSVHLPVTSGPFMVGDLVRVEGRARPLQVVGLLDKTLRTAQRLTCVEEANERNG